MKPKRWLLKAGLGIALLTYLILTITPEDILKVVSRTNISMLLSLFPFVIILYLIRGHKWRILLREIDIHVKFWQACKIVLMGTFYGILTPAKAGELARVFFLAEPKAKTLPTVLWDKIMDLAALALLSSLSLYFFFTNTILLIIVSLVLIGTIILIMSMTNTGLFLFFIDLFSFPQETSKHYFDSVQKIIRHKKTLWTVFLWSLVYYGACILLGVGVLNAINPNLPKTLAFALPFIILFGNAPFTISGLGLRESASVFAFLWMGSPASSGLLFGFSLFLLITLFPGLLGFFLNVTLREELIGIKNIPGNYYNKHTARNPLVRLLMAKFHATLDILFTKTDGKKILDVGCGEGYTTRHLLTHYKDISICGIDVEESIVKIATQLHPEINFHVGDICKLQFPDKSFDVIVANEVLEHLEQPETALKELKRVARRYCIISVPNEPFFRMANMARLRYLDDLGNTPGHVQNFTKGQFEKLLRQHFSDVEVKTSTLWNIALCRI